jgi:hypothetical protein
MCYGKGNRHGDGTDGFAMFRWELRGLDTSGTKEPMAEGGIMKSAWITFLLVLAAVLMLIVDRRLDSLAVVAPISIVVALGGAALRWNRQRRI